MFSNKTKILLMLVVAALLCASPSVRAQDTSSAAQREEGQPINKNFRSRVFVLKHREPENVMNALRPLMSGAAGATSTVSRELRTITLRDFPENITLIERAIEQLDQPEAAQQGIEFHIHILIASNNPGPSKPYPTELSDVIKQLQTTLSYKNYSLMNSDVLRAKVGPGNISNKGVAELKLSPDMAANNNPIFYEYRLGMISADTTTGGAPKVQADIFSFSMKVPVAVSTGTLQYETIGFTTPVSVREGEKVVVGTTSMQDKGLVIVITASVVK